MRNVLLVLMVSAALSACSSTPIATNAAAPVPPDQMLSKFGSQSTDGGSVVIIKRDTGFQGSACAYKVYFDGQAIANVNVGELVKLHVEPGEHVISVKSAQYLCDFGIVEHGINARSGQTHTYRMSLIPPGVIQISPTAF